ncbi:uncharacterized protein LOC118183348 [Stegodyphus dumicola]|uniref:uncharacterized protein LOC118183348 n=1 Tax=Stegodyphus dumicola TaxID=202533 RepID=UPI0015B1086B|nr:uncharacterized protein LOC118183348 [Stegodyphus dumicola]
MKDTPLKTSPVPLMPKSKIGIKKEKMAAKKIKELKTPVLKASSSKKVSLKSPGKKCSNSKEVEDPPKRKRGRPRNEDRIQNKKKVSDPKPAKKTDEVATCRKRKLPQNVVKTEKEFINPPPKKPKSNETNCNMNGSIKMPVSPVHKPCIQKGESPTVVEHTITNSNGNIHCKKTLTFGTKKPIVSSITKNSLFPTTTKREMVNGNGWVKQCKNQLTKNNKSIPKKITEVSTLPKECTKEIKVEKVNNIITPYQEPIKSHPQRMASLDALAKMHVICTTDRKPIEHHPKTTSVITVCSQPFSHQKSLTQCHESIRFDVKKESKDCKGNIVHKQINYVKEKQQVFVSHSVEQSSVLEHKEQSKALSSKSQLEKDKKKKMKPSQNSSPESTETGKSAKLRKNVSNNLKFLEILPKKGGASKSKSSKDKEDDKKSTNNKNKTPKIVKKTFKDKQDNKGNNKAKKVEQTKSEVKVKETIRMQKTCTYQSVTTVNSHGTTDSVCVPVSHVGMTTNFSKTKKTVVTDEECKNKINYSSGSVINNTYCLTSESPCSVSHRADCCKFHSHTTPQLIPFAHVQTCPIGHSMSRTSGSSSSSSSHCDGNSAVHRFSQPPVVYSPSSSDYGCCCSSSLVQNVHDSCFVRNSIVPYPHHHSHHTHHIPTSAFSSETLCTDCHRPSNTSLEASRHVQHFGLSSSSHSRVGCCSCCELVRESNQLHHQSTGSCLQYLSSSKSSASLVPCEQSPLDLSLASTSSSASVDPDFSLPTGHCPSPFCCRDLLLLRTSTPHGFQQSKFSPNKSCCRCAKQVICEKPSVETVKKVQCSNTTVKQHGQPHQSVDHVALLTSPVGKESVIPPNVSASGATSKSVPHVLTDNLVTTKREKNTSPKQSTKVSLIKKRHFAHGWSWKGEPRERLIALTNDSIPCPRTCYPSIQHKEGDTIYEKDCVLLRSGPKDTDLPYVAKVAAFWENPEDGEMMMSLLWYYRPEHTDQGRKPGQMEDEVFASRHKDVNSVACIEDKCYVLTYNEYCRYRASLSMDDDMISMASVLVPDLVDGYPRKDRLPNDVVSSDIVFFCRHVYDFRQKRILKNPS